MSNLDEMKSAFEKKLEAQRAEHAARTEKEAAELRAALLREFSASAPRDVAARARNVGSAWHPPAAPVSGLVNLTGSDRLQQLDEAFAALFELGRYYPVEKLRYPTVYCESLPEFFAPMLEMMDYSAEIRQAELAQRIRQAEEMARQTRGGGTFGVNIPGKGAYLNGWLFAYNTRLSPRQAFEKPEILRHILATAVHEKLGHGFLGVYSALGAVKTRLGLTQIDLARQFHLRTADDPIASLRTQQANLLFIFSQLLEEGWATWIESFFDARIAPGAPHPRYAPQPVLDAVQALPDDLPQRAEVQQAFFWAMVMLFGEQDLDGPDLLKALRILAMIGDSLDQYFCERLHQPLRYIIGELIMTQAECNLGAGCVPYAALIAANITFDPATISLNDLNSMLSGDPRLNPDARMVALSRLKLRQPGSVPELVRHASASLSISVPGELK